MRAVWLFRRFRLFVCRLSRDWAFGFGSDDGSSQLHALGLVSAGLGVMTMCERIFVVKDEPFGSFQLESLILAQNERWRHA